jgi:hypothetical protein
MSFLAPALLLGLLGLAAPVVAHLLGRERPREIRFGAMRFLPAAEPSVTRRRAVRDVPLLLVRLALLALLVFALARPTTEHEGGLTMVAEPHDAVLLVDASRSMGLRVDGNTMLEHAVDRAETLLQSLPAGSKVGLVTTDPGGPRIDPTADPALVRDALRRWLEGDVPRAGAWALASGLPSAAHMLRDNATGDRKQVVYALGDRAAGGLAGLPTTAEGGALVLPVPALDEDAALPEHVAIVDLQWEPAPDLDPRAARVDAVLQRFGAAEGAEPRSVTVGLLIGDNEVARTAVSLPPGEPTPVQFTHTLLEDADILPATVALLDPADDPLPNDDRRHIWLTAEDATEVAVVNGDPSELRAHDEVFFLTTAVAAKNEDRTIRVRSVATDQLAERVRKGGAAGLSDVNVLVLANVRAPEPEVAAAIIERVREGMGLLITVGDRVDAAAYNRALGQALPLMMRGTVDVGTAPGRTEARVEGVAPADLGHPIFADLDSGVGLTGASARRVMLLEPDPRRGAAIALSFTSGAPALLTRNLDAGRVALLTTSIDRDWADLPLRPGFVPMVSGMLSYLGDTQSGGTGVRLTAGEPRRERARGPLVFATPTGAEVSLAPNDGAVTFEDTFAAGHYTVRSDGAQQAVFSVEVDPAESDTTAIAKDRDDSDQASGRVAINVPQWRTLVWLALALLALEAGLRWRSRS